MSSNSAQFKNKDLCNWTISDVGNWLKLSGLNSFIKIFQVEGIDGNTLILTENKLIQQRLINNYNSTLGDIASLIEKIEKLTMSHALCASLYLYSQLVISYKL